MQILYDYNAYQLGIPLGIDWTPGPTAPVHWLVVGPSGTGKTICASSIAARCCLHMDNTTLFIASYKDDDFFSFAKEHPKGTVNYTYFNEAVEGIEAFYSILESRLAGSQDRSFCMLMVDELAAMVNSLDKKTSEHVKAMVATILQTGRSLNCQLLVSVQRADSAYFNNGARENFGMVLFLGSYITKEAAAMFGIDRDTLTPLVGRAGRLIINGDSENLCTVTVPTITDSTKLKAALLKGMT